MTETRRRADARRNRERLVDAALTAFTAAGEDTVALETIARDAGVGIGTLYRHFPSRAALIEAVYRSELARLCDLAPQLAAQHPADEALRRWMGCYVEFVRTKRGMPEALREVLASGAVTSADTRERLAEAARALLEAGAGAGSLRTDVRAEDVVAALAGVVLACRTPAQAEQTDRILDLFVDGLRAR